MLGVYTFVLAVALPLVTRLPARTLAAGGAAVFAAASAACGLADSITALLVFRGVQALGGAALLVGAFTLRSTPSDAPGGACGPRSRSSASRPARRSAGR